MGSWAASGCRTAWPFRQLRLARRAGPADGGEEEDWRDFRARLVQQERGEIAAAADDQADGWAYQTDLLEQGSLLLSVPGDYWSLRRQYFCKVVMLVISHTPRFSAGLVLNRPTNLTASSLGISSDAGMADPVQDQILRLAGLKKEPDDWKVWFGGDCEGLEMAASGVEPKHFCLHTLESLADQSRRVIRGIFLIEFKQAQTLVKQGLARKDDFMLMVGYTGWGPGQLQDELERGGAWVLGAADKGLLLGEPGDSTGSLVSRMLSVCERRPGESAITGAAGFASPPPACGSPVGDGIHHWNQLFKALRPDEFAGLEGDEEAHNDNMIRRWVDLYLNPQSDLDGQDASLTVEALPAGTILRGSATKWALGRPDASWPTRERIDPWQIPAQYIHKGVLYLVEDWSSGGASELVLVNGPRIGSLPDGRDVRFGGTEACTSANVLDIDGAGVVAGKIAFPRGVLDKLLRSGALAVAEGKSIRDFTRFGASSAEQVAIIGPRMWEAAGGTIASLSDVAAAVEGDRQLRKWYREMLGLSLSAEP